MSIYYTDKLIPLTMSIRLYVSKVIKIIKS